MQKYKCENCDKTFTTKHKYNEHLTKLIFPCSFTCKICNKKNKNKKEYNKHIITHEKELQEVPALTKDNDEIVTIPPLNMTQIIPVQDFSYEMLQEISRLQALGYEIIEDVQAQTIHLMSKTIDDNKLQLEERILGYRRVTMFHAQNAKNALEKVSAKIKLIALRPITFEGEVGYDVIEKLMMNLLTTVTKEGNPALQNIYLGDKSRKTIRMFERLKDDNTCIWKIHQRDQGLEMIKEYGKQLFSKLLDITTREFIAGMYNFFPCIIWHAEGLQYCIIIYENNDNNIIIIDVPCYKVVRCGILDDPPRPKLLNHVQKQKEIALKMIYKVILKNTDIMKYLRDCCQKKI